MKYRLLFINLIFINLNFFTQTINLYQSDMSGWGMTKVGNELFFIDRNKSILYKSDGVNPPMLVKQLYATQTSIGSIVQNVTDGTNFYFSTFNGSSYQMWKSNGTSNGTVLLKSSTRPINGRDIVVIQDSVYFLGHDSVYIIRPNSIKGIRKSYDTFSNYTIINNIFSYKNYLMMTDMQLGRLYAYNVSTKNTTTILTFSYFGQPLTRKMAYVFNDTLILDVLDDFYYVISPNLTYFKSDTSKLSGNIVGKVNNKLLITASAKTSNDYELYEYNIANNKFNLIKNINPTTTSDLFTFGSTDSLIFFSADDGTNGREPWVTDGTLNNTHLLTNFTAGAGSSQLYGDYTPVLKNKYTGNCANYIYFSIDSGTSGLDSDFLKSNGTSINTIDLTAASDESSWYFEELNGDIFFTLAYTFAPIYNIYKFSCSSGVPTNINETKNLIHLNIYPIPSNGKVEIDSQKEIINYSIYDVQGNIIEWKILSDGKMHFETRIPDNGIYLFKCTFSDGNTECKKILIN